MSTQEIEIKCRELRQLQALIEEAQAETEAIKDSIKAVMGGSEELKAGEYKITWKAVASTRVDTAALKQAFPEIAQRFKRQSSTRRFVIA